MNPLITALAFGRAISFKGVSLTQRYLQEKGASPFTTYKLKRYVLLPAILWLVIFVRPGDLSFIYHNRPLLALMIALPITHELNEFFFSYVTNVTSSMSDCTVLTNIFSLPLLLFIGAYFNHDKPNAFIVIAIALLIVAHLIQPVKHRRNLHKRFSHSVVVVVGLIFLQTLA